MDVIDKVASNNSLMFNQIQLNALKQCDSKELTDAVEGINNIIFPKNMCHISEIPFQETLIHRISQFDKTLKEFNEKMPSKIESSNILAINISATFYEFLRNARSINEFSAAKSILRLAKKRNLLLTNFKQRIYLQFEKMYNEIQNHETKTAANIINKKCSFKQKSTNLIASVINKGGKNAFSDYINYFKVVFLENASIFKTCENFDLLSDKLEALEMEISSFKHDDPTIEEFVMDFSLNLKAIDLYLSQTKRFIRQTDLINNPDELISKIIRFRALIQYTNETLRNSLNKPENWLDEYCTQVNPRSLEDKFFKLDKKKIYSMDELFKIFCQPSAISVGVSNIPRAILIDLLTSKNVEICKNVAKLLINQPLFNSNNEFMEILNFILSDEFQSDNEKREKLEFNYSFMLLLDAEYYTPKNNTNPKISVNMASFENIRLLFPKVYSSNNKKKAEMNKSIVCLTDILDTVSRGATIDKEFFFNFDIFLVVHIKLMEEFYGKLNKNLTENKITYDINAYMEDVKNKKISNMRCADLIKNYIKNLHFHKSHIEKYSPYIIKSLSIIKI